ncbi:MAG: hypothetical protein R2827_11900 [Bdellovibrionales bacterium]
MPNQLHCRGKSLISALAPSGQWLLFSSNIETPNQQELYLVKPNGILAFSASHSSANEVWPQFSPDGKYITFSSNKTGTSQVYIMDFKPRATCPDDAPTVDS